MLDPKPVQNLSYSALDGGTLAEIFWTEPDWSSTGPITGYISPYNAVVFPTFIITSKIIPVRIYSMLLHEVRRLKLHFIDTHIHGVMAKWILVRDQTYF